MITAPGLSSAISDLRHIQEVAPLAARAAVDPLEYHDALIEVARETINGIKAEGWELPQDWDTMVGVLLATISLGVLEDGFSISMGPVPKEVQGAMANQVSGIPRLSREAIIEWIARYKRLDPKRDQTSHGYYSFRKLAERLVFKILNDPEPWFRTDLPGHGALDPQGLAQFLGVLPVQGTQLSFILISVLKAWRGYVRKGMIDRFTDYLNKMA